MSEQSKRAMGCKQVRQSHYKKKLQGYKSYGDWNKKQESKMKKRLCSKGKKKHVWPCLTIRSTIYYPQTFTKHDFTMLHSVILYEMHDLFHKNMYLERSFKTVLMVKAASAGSVSCVSFILSRSLTLVANSVILLSQSWQTQYLFYLKHPHTCVVQWVIWGSNFTAFFMLPALPAAAVSPGGYLATQTAPPHFWPDCLDLSVWEKLFS